MPPAVQHAHVEGDIAHAHGSSAETVTPPEEQHRKEQHGHDHAHAHHHSHRHSHRHVDDKPVPATLIPRTTTSHRHVVMLGIELCLPSGESRGSSDDAENRESDRLCVVRLRDAQAISVRVSQVDSLIETVALQECDAAGGTESLEVRSSQQTLSSLPLCDTARRARSGVRLI
jgi:hypothetical protein